MTLQHSVVAEHVVIRASNHDFQPPVFAHSIKHRERKFASILGPSRIGLSLVVAHKKHYRLSDAFADDTAPWSPVQVEARLASIIIVAELQGFRTSERVTERIDPLHIEPPSEPARGVRGV